MAARDSFVHTRLQGHMLDADTTRTHHVHTGDIDRLKIRLLLRGLVMRAGLDDPGRIALRQRP